MVNKKCCSIIWSLLFSLLLFSCNENKKLNNHATFGFKNLNSSYDSKTNTFTRRYGDGDSIQVKITLTTEEKEKIQHTFFENNFQNLPTTINCTSWGVHPKIYDCIFFDGSIVQYIHNSHNKKWLCPSGKKFDKINAVLQDIILNKPEIKELQPSGIAYE
ncbi:hypothetical protein VUJ46_17085 [Chryseobacterium sp. MYb264]|uniref:hypothetical protein n=1 Tax=Chryseobacterium sp. MYb264 TaxID=2745153 RepID=UPI002E10097F|nr:hypothetical protein VUJ46_17085 [Chryseobacterium sp. MYb264]